MKKVYLDNCTFNRPFDAQESVEVKFEAEAKIQFKKKVAELKVAECKKVIEEALKLQNLGLKSKDALHVACAVKAGADYFITTDKELLKKLRGYNHILVVNPVNFLMDSEEVQ